MDDKEKRLEQERVERRRSLELREAEAKGREENHPKILGLVFVIGLLLVIADFEGTPLQGIHIFGGFVCVVSGLFLWTLMSRDKD